MSLKSRVLPLWGGPGYFAGSLSLVQENVDPIFPCRFREADALAAAAEKWRDDIESFVAEQFLFDRQWKAVKSYANERNVNIVGDMPIYVGAQSADVWCFPDLFELGESGAPIIVSGVPPDAFSETGQLWGSPLYDWQVGRRLS